VSSDVSRSEASIRIRSRADEQCACSCRFVQFMRDRKLTPQPLAASEGGGPVYVVLQNEVETPGGLPHIAELPNAVTAKQVSATHMVTARLSALMSWLFQPSQDAPAASQCLQPRTSY